MVDMQDEDAWVRLVETFPDPEPMPIDVALDEAADLFETGALGWMQGSPGWSEDRTKACMMQAVVVATGAEHDVNRSCSYAVRYVTKAMGQPGYKWNDVEGRTMEEVIEKLRELAKQHREESQV